MDAVTPRPLTLDDLTRDELLEYIRRAMPFHRQRDLWRARWEVAGQKSGEADQRMVEAAKRRCEASDAYAAAAGASPRKLITLRKAYERARNECDAAFAAQERAWAAEQRAYTALSACKG